jgi:hypothetical protein
MWDIFLLPNRVEDPVPPELRFAKAFLIKIWRGETAMTFGQRFES